MTKYVLLRHYGNQFPIIASKPLTSLPDLKAAWEEADRAYLRTSTVMHSAVAVDDDNATPVHKLHEGNTRPLNYPERRQWQRLHR